MTASTYYAQTSLNYIHICILYSIYLPRAGKRVLIAAHGNSLRGVVKHLDNISDEDIMGLNLPTGTNTGHPPKIDRIS